MSRLTHGLAWALLAFVPSLGVTFSSTTAADDSPFWEKLQEKGFQIHGFASLTGVKTSANRFYGNSPDGSWDDIEVGLNVSYRFNPRVFVAGQVISRQAGDMYDGTPSLDYGLIDLSLVKTADQDLGVRLGRLKNPLGLYNETRDVPFTRPSIFLPQVVYFDKARNLLLSTDGLMLHGEQATAHGTYALVLGGGQAVTDETLEWVFLGGDGPGKLGPHGLSLIGSLWYATPDERLRLGLSGVDSTFSYEAGGPEDSYTSGQTHTTYLILSAQYNTELWTFSSEYARLPMQYRDYGPYLPYSDLDGEGYYFQAAYRFRPDLEGLLRYEEGFTDRGGRDGQALSDQTGGYVPPFDFYAHAWTAGLTWTPNAHVMLRAQYSRTNGTYTLSVRENDPADLIKDWDLFALQIAVRF